MMYSFGIMICCFATLRIGSAYDRLYKSSKGSPLPQLFTFHYSLNGLLFQKEFALEPCKIIPKSNNKKSEKIFKKISKKLLTTAVGFAIIGNVPSEQDMREWRNRQTRTFEGRVVIPYGFKSRLSHQRGFRKESSFCKRKKLCAPPRHPRRVKIRGDICGYGGIGRRVRFRF